MPVPDNASKYEYTANGVTSEFAFPNKFFKNEDLKVVVTPDGEESETQVLGTDYTVAGAGLKDGGSVTFLAGHLPPDASRVTIYREVDATQETDYEEGGTFPAATVTNDLDKLCMEVQQLKEEVSRCFKYASTEPIGSETEIESASARAEKYIYFDVNGVLTISPYAGGSAAIADKSLKPIKWEDIPADRLVGRISSTGEIQYLTAAQVKALLTLENVTNTSDANKPVSTAQAAAIASVQGASLQKLQNLADLSSAATARSNLGVYSSTYVDGVVGTAGTLMYKNRLINGNFDIWQRGTTFSNPTNSATSYCADRWCANRGSYQNNLTVSRISLVGSGVPGATVGVRVQRTAGDTSTANIRIAQMIANEDLKQQASSYTLSFYARAGSNYSGDGASLLFPVVVGGSGSDENDITGAGYTGRTTIISSQKTLTTEWQKFVITGASAGSVSEMAVEFFMNPTGTAGANDYFDLAQVQLELGGSATPFEFRPYETELKLCQRYFYSPIYYGWELGLGVTTATNTVSVPIYFPAMMRVNPTLLSSGISGTNLVFSGGITSNPTAVVIDIQGQRVTSLAFTSTSVTAGLVGKLRSSAGAGVIQFNAEI